VLLVDADRDPSQSVLAGYLRGTEAGVRGMTALARHHGDRRSLPQELWQQCLFLTGDDSPARRFLPGFTHPGTPGLFLPLWPDLAATFTTLEDNGTDVIVDAGRLGPDGLPPALLSHADLLLICVRSSLRSLAALRLHLPGVRAQVETAIGQPRPALCVVGPNRPYTPTAIAEQFELPVSVTIAYDPRDAGVLSEGDAESRHFATGPLMRSLRTAASSIAAELEHRRGLGQRPSDADALAVNE